MRRIGILINTIYSDYSVMLLRGAERYCEENDCVYFVFPVAHGNNSGVYDYHYETLFDFITKNNIDGLLIITTTLAYDVNMQSVVDAIKSLPQELPKISLGFEIKGIPTITIESRRALKMLCLHLIEKHKIKNPLVFRCSKGNFESDEREGVVLSTFAECGIEIPKDRILNGAFLSDNAYVALTKYIKSNGTDFDAVICLNDTMAMGVSKCLMELGFQIPHDKIVTGFDNIYETARSELNITTVDQRLEDFIYVAMSDLEEMMNGKKDEAFKTIEAVPVFRASCGCGEEKENLIPQKSVELLRQRYEVLRMSGMQIYMLHYFMMETQTPILLDSLYSRLNYSFKLFDIKSFAMILYDSPVFYSKNSDFDRPINAKLVMTFFDEETFERPDIVFNPNVNMLPLTVMEKLRGEYIVYPLFAERLQYGYLIFKFGQYEKIFYQTVYELIAKEIVTSIKLSTEQNENSSLKNQNSSLEEFSKKMRELSFTDDMTGLLNRRGFYEYVGRLISRQTEDSGLLIYCDMDGLKKINDTYGHDAGDRAIKYEARILKKIFRSSDIVARLGGDEFAVVANGMKAKDFARIKKSICAECEKINTETLEPFVLSLSCGFSELKTSSMSLDEILSAADASQYEDKNSKKKKQEAKEKKGWFGK